MDLDPQIVAALKTVSTATITTVLLKKGLRNVWLRGTKPLRAGQPRLIGRAFTMRFVPAREDLATPESWSSPSSTRAAIEDMPEGVITVIDAMGVTDAGMFGDILCARMAKRGVAALVTDGVVRDVAGVLGTGLPVWCQGCGGAGLGGRADIRELAGADRLRRRGGVPRRRDHGRRGRRGGHSAEAAGGCRGDRGGPGADGRVDHGRGEQGRLAARPVSAERREQGAL